jgi:hypothetical protein
MHKVSWVDGGAWPKNPPNPKYPDGVDLDMSKGSDERTCFVALPYPAKRIGYYAIECEVCGLITAVSTAGRPDDPRSVKLRCKRRLQ